MNGFAVVVTDDRFGSYKEEEAVLREAGARLTIRNLQGETEGIEALRKADAVLVNLYPLSGRIIERMESCRVISRYGVGYDNVDVEAATRRGIWVARVPDYCLEDVSDHALALLLGCIRKIAYKDRKVREGRWDLQKDQPCYRIQGKVLGLIGYGGIARTLHRKVSGFGLSKVLAFDPLIDPALIRAGGGVPVDMDTLLRESDYISIHVPLLPLTRNLIGEKELSRMKRGAILINTSRGPVVDEKALIAVLRGARVAGAGLDVFEQEPIDPDSPLKRLESVILSDHSGWYSEESIIELKTKAARNIAEVLKGGRPLYPVNSI